MNAAVGLRELHTAALSSAACLGDDSSGHAPPPQWVIWAIEEGNKMENLAGQLLIAIPELPDQNFFRSVVLMIQHTSEGATGVILNRPSNTTVAEVWDEISDVECDCSQSVSVGGPVEGPLLALHTSLALADSQVVPGVYLTLRRENLNQLVVQDKQQFRIFSGYAGWGPKQLEMEIEHGGWLTFPAKYDHIFDPPDKLWKKVCEHVGHDIILPQIGFDDFPGDPSLN